MANDQKMFFGILILAIIGFGLYFYFNKKSSEGFETQKAMNEAPFVPAEVAQKMKEKKTEEDDALMVDPSGEAPETFQNQADEMMNMPPQTQQLTANDLLPNDANSSQWAQVYPTGESKLKDRNFLQAGYHIGINTVGQTLRNANLQLRSEPPNPQVKVSPWIQSTIEPDLGRKPFEIGGCA